MPKKVGLGEEFWIRICDRALPAKKTEDGVRAVIKDKPIDPEPVEKYLRGKFGEQLDAARKALADLAGAFSPEELEDVAWDLYDKFRPAIPPGRRGWGAKGELDLDLIRSLGREG